jgi:hypothetical protein
MVPIMTCKPWKPVPKKKQEPYAPSDIVKDDTEYSIPWQAVNTIASITVKTKPYKAPLLLPCISEWCAYVTVT